MRAIAQSEMKDLKNKDRRRPANSLRIVDVARQAHVSTATVSRVINGASFVDKTLIRRVTEAIDKLGYIPNKSARALVTGRSNLLCLFILAESPFGQIASSFQEKAWALGYEVMICSLDKDVREKVLNVMRMLSRDVEGIAVLSCDPDDSVIDDVSSLEIPQIWVNASRLPVTGRSLSVDYDPGIREAVQHLASLGHRELAFIGGTHARRTDELKLEAFIRSIREIGCESNHELIIESDESCEGGVEAAGRLLATRARPSAVICSSEMLTFGCLRGLYRRGIVVPDQMSVIGFEDNGMAASATPPLTTIQAPWSDIGRTTAEVLHRLVEYPERPIPTGTLEARTFLVKRESTGFPFGRGLRIRWPSDRSRWE